MPRVTNVNAGSPESTRKGQATIVNAPRKKVRLRQASVASQRVARTCHASLLAPRRTSQVVNKHRPARPPRRRPRPCRTDPTRSIIPSRRGGFVGASPKSGGGWPRGRRQEPQRRRPGPAVSSRLATSARTRLATSARRDERFNARPGSAVADGRGRRVARVVCRAHAMPCTKSRNQCPVNTNCSVCDPPNLQGLDGTKGMGGVSRLSWGPRGVWGPHVCHGDTSAPLSEARPPW